MRAERVIASLAVVARTGRLLSILMAAARVGFRAMMMRLESIVNLVSQTTEHGQHREHGEKAVAEQVDHRRGR